MAKEILAEDVVALQSGAALPMCAVVMRKDLDNQNNYDN